MSNSLKVNPVELAPLEFKPGIEIGGTYPDGRPLVRCCAHLRCKSLYYSGVERPGLLHISESMTYWCLHTQQGIGADAGETHPEACQAGRSCFEA